MGDAIVGVPIAIVGTTSGHHPSGTEGVVARRCPSCPSIRLAIAGIRAAAEAPQADEQCDAHEYDGSDGEDDEPAAEPRLERTCR